MRAALLFGYALVVAWSAPALLMPLTSRGVSARLGLTAWLTAMASVLASLGTALLLLVRSAVAGWPGLAEVVCRSVSGGSCTPRVYRSALFEFGLSVAATVAVIIAVLLAWRYAHGIQRTRQGNRAHAEAARLTGRKLPGTLGPRGTVVLESPLPVAYCVPGRPSAIVLSTGALAVLDPEQLTAVLAHERAHLAARHHALIALTRVLAATFPAVPLFTRGRAEVNRLAEMCADDAAARRNGRHTLLTALLAMGTGTAVPAVPAGPAVPTGALAASTYEVTARVQRLLEPPGRARRARYGLILSGAALALPLASALLAVTG
jgi:Peptidase family M48